jgi:TRAP-type uncharacterized transport system fused permease subunit
MGYLIENTKKYLSIERVRHSSFWASIFLVFSVMPIATAILQLFRIPFFGITLIENAYLYCMLTFYLPVVFLVQPLTSSSPKDRVPWYDVILFVVTAATCGYFAIKGMEIVQMGWEFSAPLFPSLLSVLLWGLVIEAVRRTADFALTITCFLPVSTVCPTYAGNPAGSGIRPPDVCTVACDGVEQHYRAAVLRSLQPSRRVHLVRDVASEHRWRHLLLQSGERPIG